MPLLSISQLVSTETQAQVMQTLLDIAASVGVDTTSWQSGQPLRSFFAVCAQKLADYTTVRAQLASMGLLDLATGDWLALYASSMFGVTKIFATAASGAVTFTNTGGSQAIGIGQIIVAHSVTGATYRNTVAFTLATGTTTVAIAADAVGTGSNAAPGFVSVMVTSIVGVTVTNALAVLGTDDETDEALRVRCRQQQAATSPAGPWDAYSYVAKTPSYSATSVAITRIQQVLDTTTGILTGYLANANGAPSGGDVTIVQNAWDTWVEPQGILSQAVAAANLTVNVTSIVYVAGKSTTRTVAQIQSDVAAALAVYFASIPIGGYIVPPANGLVYLDGIRGAIRDSTPGVVLSTVTTPATDLPVAAGQVPILGTVSTSVVFV